MPTILIIEDNKDILDILSELLKTENYNVLSADNGTSGLELATEYIPDLIICDVVMQELNGFQVIEQLKRNSNTKDIPVAFLSAIADSESIEKGIALGATFITKPFYWQELLQKIKELIDK